MCGGLESVVRLIKIVFRIFEFGIPILLLLFGAIDLGKAVVASKEDEQKKAQNMLLKRAIYALLVFFLFALVSLVMNLVGQSQVNDPANAGNTLNWASCWSEV